MPQLWHCALQETPWEAPRHDGGTSDGDPNSDKYDILYAKEFRYDGARQRYLSRALNPSRLEDDVIESLTGQVIWSDYDGDAIYGDFKVSAGVATQEADYEPGVGRSYSPGVASATMYYHQDLLGSTRMMTNASQSQLERQWYSAFGESGNAQVSQRYGYAGAWGYQTDTAADGFPFMHLGARYYDPATGRFLQRDPIGSRGGMNVYEYAASSPAVRVDPQGLLPHNGLGPPFCPGCNERNGGRMVDMMPEFDPSKLKGPYQKAIWATACIMALAEEILAILPQKKHREPSEDVNPELRSGNPRPRHNKPWYRDFVDGLLDWLENPYPL